MITFAFAALVGAAVAHPHHGRGGDRPHYGEALAVEPNCDSADCCRSMSGITCYWNGWACNCHTYEQEHQHPIRDRLEQWREEHQHPIRDKLEEWKEDGREFAHKVHEKRRKRKQHRKDKAAKMHKKWESFKERAAPVFEDILEEVAEDYQELVDAVPEKFEKYSGLFEDLANTAA